MKNDRSIECTESNREYNIVKSARLFAILFFLLFTFHFSLSIASAQDGPDEMAPPPLKLISKAEKASLEADKDVRNRTKLALDMMQRRLESAEKLYSGSDYDGMFHDLGDFQGLVDNTLDYLIQNDDKSNKFLDNFKKLEIALRSFTPRIETIRREVPLRFEHYLGGLLKYIRDARAKSADPMFSDTVVPSNNAKNHF